MALLFHGREAPPLESLFAQACATGVYRRMDDGRWKGAFHEPLCGFLKHFEFAAERFERATVGDVADRIRTGWQALLSVSPDIRYPNRTPPEKRNGHMVFAYKADRLADGTHVVEIHNPAGFASLNSQIAFRVPEERLAQVFSGNAICIRRA